MNTGACSRVARAPLPRAWPSGRSEPVSFGARAPDGGADRPKSSRLGRRRASPPAGSGRAGARAGGGVAAAAGRGCDRTAGSLAPRRPVPATGRYVRARVGHFSMLSSHQFSAARCLVPSAAEGGRFPCSPDPVGPVGPRVRRRPAGLPVRLQFHQLQIFRPRPGSRCRRISCEQPGRTASRATRGRAARRVFLAIGPAAGERPGPNPTRPGCQPAGAAPGVVVQHDREQVPQQHDVRRGRCRDLRPGNSLQRAAFAR